MLEIVDLAELADREPLHRELARLHVAEWGHLYAPTVWDEAVATAELRAMGATPGIPRTLLAFDGADRSLDALAGSVCLLATDDLAGWEGVGPWLASLWVMPKARRRGVATALVDRCLRLAGELGHDVVHLFTAGQEGWYAQRGWRTVGHADANGTAAVVMARGTDPLAARRSVTSRWVGDPDVGGAYSFLRPGGTPADRDRLGAAARRGLWFAGEHTWSAGPGTMHGAWFSGERAAAGVIAEGATRAVVVGAGLAGLAAAQRLQAGGVAVVVVEARAKPGGRAATDRTLGVPLHLGGAWLHGTDGHPLAALESIPWGWSRTTTFVLGQGVLPAAQQSRLAAVQETVEDELDAAAAPDAPDVALGPVARAAMAARPTGGLDRAVLDAWLRGSYENLYAAPLDELSVRHRAEPYHLGGGDHLLTTPLDGFVDAAAARVDVRCGRRVTRIAQHGAGWSVAGDGFDVGGDAVVVTVPVPVLHAGRIEFRPPLPDDVRAALDRIGCGPVAKLFATFDVPFWSPHRAFWVVGPEPLPVELFVDVSALAGIPALCGFAVGAHAAAIEAMSEDARCRLVDRLLADVRAAARP